MITNNTDLYAVVRVLIGDLHRANNALRATELQDALTCGATAGEVLGAIRLQLREVRRVDDARIVALRPYIDAALHYLDVALGPLPSGWDENRA